VTGTDTGVGKTVVAAAICAALAARSERVAAFKPAVTGLDEQQGAWPYDHVLLASVASSGQSPEDVAPYRFGPPVSPHHAAELAGTQIDFTRLHALASAAAAGADALVCEGVGGLMVPLTDRHLVRDLAAGLGLPIVIVARPGVGTISHTLLTIEAARAAHLRPAGVVMTPWPARPSPGELSNRRSVELLGGCPVVGLNRCEVRDLAEAGNSLPLANWLGEQGDDSARTVIRRSASDEG